MKYKYKKIFKGIIRPIIPIELEFKGQRIFYEVLVDSGADSCIFDAEIGDLLGIDLESGFRSEVGGINGKPEPYFIHPVTMHVGGWKYDIFSGFKKDFPKFGYGVVGQKGFFEHFLVNFDYQKEEVEILPRK